MTTKTTGTTRIEGLVPVVPTPLRIRGIVSVVRTTDTVVVGGS